MEKRCSISIFFLVVMIMIIIGVYRLQWLSIGYVVVSGQRRSCFAPLLSSFGKVG
jgi:hypothetical protein